MRQRGAPQERAVLALDLSLRSTGMCCIPPGWDGQNLDLVRMGRAGYELKAPNEQAQVKRYQAIAEAVSNFARPLVLAGCIAIDRVYVEDYAYSAGNANAHRLAEMRGVVKHYLWTEYLLPLEAIPIASARKTLLQKLPRADVKDYVERNVRRLKGETYYWNLDELDAFVVANHARMSLGLTHMSFPGV